MHKLIALSRIDYIYRYRLMRTFSKLEFGHSVVPTVPASQNLGKIEGWNNSGTDQQGRADLCAIWSCGPTWRWRPWAGRGTRAGTSSPCRRTRRRPSASTTAESRRSSWRSCAGTSPTSPSCSCRAPTAAQHIGVFFFHFHLSTHL